MTFTILLLYGPVVYFSERSFGLVLVFSAEDWLLSLGLGVTSSIVQISKNKALQYEEPARLGALMYLQSVL